MEEFYKGLSRSAENVDGRSWNLQQGKETRHFLTSNLKSIETGRDVGAFTIFLSA